MQVTVQPVSAIIPTANRPDVLRRTIISLSGQNVQPQELIIIDATVSDETKEVCDEIYPNLHAQISYQRAGEKGAAAQRNQGGALARCRFILFCDDDIVFEEFCLERLWNGINSEKNIGGVNAMITNQRYLSPGKVTAFMYRLMSGEKLKTYAGRCIGPAWNLLPEDNNNLPEIVKVDWLNTTCTLYKKEALPDPFFSRHFTGYSMMEDLTLSSIVGRQWKLVNARTARIYHDSQPGSHKSSAFQLAKMELINRQFVMSRILCRNSFMDYLKMIVLELFSLAAGLATLNGLKNFPAILCGKIAGLGSVLNKRLFARTDV